MMKIQGLEPIADSDSRVLILGSMPSEKSLQLGQYYGNRTNQFWKILSALFKAEEPVDYRKKRVMLRKFRIALWDVLKSCSRSGSSDSSIKHAAVNDIPGFLMRNHQIRLILLNGKTAEEHFTKTVASSVKIPFTYVPSSSAANARLDLNKKIALWQKVFKVNR